MTRAGAARSRRLAAGVEAAWPVGAADGLVRDLLLEVAFGGADAAGDHLGPALAIDVTRGHRVGQADGIVAVPECGTAEIGQVERVELRIADRQRRAAAVRREFEVGAACSDDR